MSVTIGRLTNLRHKRENDIINQYNYSYNQALNYLIFTDCNYGKLINFSETSVKTEYITTSLTRNDRYIFSLIFDKWIDIDDDSKWLKELIVSLLRECGAFISFQFFYDVIYFFRGGKEKVVKPVKVKLDKIFVGTQNFNNHNIEFETINKKQ